MAHCPVRNCWQYRVTLHLGAPRVSRRGRMPNLKAPRHHLLRQPVSPLEGAGGTGGSWRQAIFSLQRVSPCLFFFQSFFSFPFLLLTSGIHFLSLGRRYLHHRGVSPRLGYLMESSDLGMLRAHPGSGGGLGTRLLQALGGPPALLYLHCNASTTMV